MLLILILNKQEMKQKIFIRLLFLLIGIQQLQAQDAIANSGGNATGSNGTVSYTVGQVAYTSQTGASGSVAQGVQQPSDAQPGPERHGNRAVPGLFPLDRRAAPGRPP